MKGSRVAGRAAVTLAVGLASAAGPVRAQAPYTLEDVLSAPFPSALTADTEGRRVAWVQNDEGVRDIWVAEAPDFQGRRLTDYGAEDGQEITDLQFAQGGAALVYVRGGSPNQAGELPNPTSDPEGVSRAIWRVALGGGDPVRLTGGSSPSVSPDGSTVAYLDRGIRVVSAEGGEERLLVNARGGEGSLTWSPDSRRLAFVSGRGDHAFVGVIDVPSRELTWMDPGIDRDGSPAWSPDGTRVAFIRVPFDRDVLPYMAARTAVPWSIRVADVSTGRGTEVWRAPEGPGSAFRGVGGGNLVWAGDQLVFPWEQSGWLHLYRIPAGGGEAVALTEGAYEVEEARLTRSGESMLVTSNRGEIDGRGVWEVPIGGGEAWRRTPEGAIHWSGVVLQGARFASLGASATTPAQALLMDVDYVRPLDPAGLPSDFPQDHLVEPTAVEFPASDGMPIRGQLFLPPGAADGQPRPAVIFFHGGSRRQMLLGFHYIGYYHNAYAFNQYLASRGYVVLSVNYRSGTGYGLDFREALDYGARGASEFRDVLGAGLYLAERDEVDPDRIGLWGGSYGGYLTALGLARASDLFAAGVDFHGVHDWNIEFDFDNRVLPDQIPELDDVKRLAWESSPMSSVDTWESPVLFIHGDDDRNVPFRETVDLAQKLRRGGVEVEFLTFPDEVHGFLLHASWLRAYEAAAAFLDEHLATGRTSE